MLQPVLERAHDALQLFDRDGPSRFLRGCGGAAPLVELERDTVGLKRGDDTAKKDEPLRDRS
jgi:hypothetical protein